MKTTTSQQPIAGWLVGLLLLIALPSWGQTDKTSIQAASNRSSVHTRTQIIYVDKERELYVPELRINDASASSNRDYAWYVHWYGSKGTIAGKTITVEKEWAQQRGGIVIGGTYRTDLREATDGLWWYEGYGTDNINNPTAGLSTATNDQGHYLHLASCASTITYTAPTDFTADELICDVSNYRDYSWSNTTFKEPTLLKRYKYILRPAKECADALQTGPLEVYEIDYPQGEKHVNFSMLSLPQNYFWYTGNGNGNLLSGEQFKYAIGENGTYKTFTYDQVQTIDLSTYTQAVTVYVKASNSKNNGNGNDSPVLATFTFNPVADSGFELEGEITNNIQRNPEDHPDLYEEIGSVDFDKNEVTNSLTAENNIAAEPLPSDWTTYGFMYKNVASQRTRLTSAQNQYGLYRSAGVEGVSKNLKEYTTGKSYLWIPNTSTANGLYENTVFYDRTHARNEGQYGYFYYTDASDDPGTLVDIPIKGTLCGNTELTVTAWVSDMTRAGLASGNQPLAPNINLILKGTSNSGAEVVLHQFTSGDAKTNYVNNINQNLMQWQQLCYRITIDNDKLQGCTEFHLEVQNNEPHTDGADYAIDDIRIYKSKPNIQVRRIDKCDASTLEIKTPYSTLLRNLGLQAGEISDAKARFAFFEYEDGSVGKPVIVNKDGTTDIAKYVITTDIPTTESTSDQHPYIDISGIVHLAMLQVTNTGLKYAGEKAPNSDEAASGKYWVMLITDPIVDEDNWSTSNLTPNDKCALLSEFTVLPSFTIAIETSSSAKGIACQGSIAEVTPTLWVAEIDAANNPTGKVLEFEKAYSNGSYTFDWFLGSMDDYSKIVVDGSDLQDLIAAYRDAQSYSTASFSKEDILKYYKNNNNQDAYDLFNELLGDNEHEPKLIIGDGTGKAEIRWTDKVVAIPYVPTITSPSNSYEFCTYPQERTLAISPSPTMLIGFPDVNYPDLTNGVPLRVGLAHIANGQSLNDVPIQKNITFGMATESDATIGLPSQNNRTIYLRQGQNYVSVGTVTALSANTNKGGSLSLSFNYKYTQFAEGEIYTLYIPFGEYNGKTQVDGSCEGYALLPIKVVPEYLTWQGNESESNVWYNDGMWKQSTKGELFFDGNGETDANGTDDVTKAFAPLYFTKITIPEGKQLNLEEAIPNENEIQYDMAVDQVGDNLQIVPYYINKVDEIYFKPGATLMNQHLLTYNKAWVEFYLGKNQPNWMASPLHATYAGDFYAPKEKGSQDTPAFQEIKYDSQANSRWGLPFYQKAWNRAVSYVPYGTEHNNGVEVALVQSNWSIEYNDVWVPYSIGKGFYVRYGEGEAEEKEQVKVRLPKADTNYSYETKALSTAPETRTHAYRLAGTNGEENGTVSVELSAVDGDGKHFLIGNPYMTYLDMAQFFEANTSLAKKYWTLGAGNATEAHVVGTPDIAFDESAAGYVAGTGTIAPMQAFFVELASTAEGLAEGEGATTTTSQTVVFKPAMMAASASTDGDETQTTAFSATNPMITLTATQGDWQSHATLLAADGANNGYKAAEDAVALIDSELCAPVVYSVAGSQAAQVNAVKEIRNVGLGVYAEGNEEVTLTLSGLDRFAAPLSLYDAVTRKSQRLEGDRFSLTLTGSSHGRYFLRSEQPTGTETIAAQSITIYSAEPGKVVIDALQPIRSIQVFRIDGSQERNWEVNSTHQTLHLPTGIYVIRVSDETTEQTEKLYVR